MSKSEWDSGGPKLFQRGSLEASFEPITPGAFSQSAVDKNLETLKDSRRSSALALRRGPNPWLREARRITTYLTLSDGCGSIGSWMLRSVGRHGLPNILLMNFVLAFAATIHHLQR
ncbi:hypothetical protein R1flu_017363 [Riccia fluitans]|uniref:Uncharacterized protein n=1 Tax=Riccia fluitans TaxID=41844 RepID=A0ABD1ZE20_9MARC